MTLMRILFQGDCDVDSVTEAGPGDKLAIW
jgi:hypothetical protein